MENVIIKQVLNDKDLIKFIKFPMELYRNNPNYVPPLINEEKNIWKKEENPALSYSEAKQFLAYKNNDHKFTYINNICRHYFDLPKDHNAEGRLISGIPTYLSDFQAMTDSANNMIMLQDKMALFT